MIPNALIALVTTVVNFFQSLIPNVSVPSWLTTDALGSGLATTIGQFLSPLNAFLPVDAMINVLLALLVLLPLIIGYEIFQWAWEHVPEIFGFGT